MASSMRLPLRRIRDVFHLVGEVRERSDDPDRWRTHLVARTCHLLHAAVVVSSELHVQRRSGTGAAGVLRVTDFGWGTDAAGETWRIHTDQDDNPATFGLRIADGSAADGSPAAVPVRRLRPGSMFILAQSLLPHRGVIDQLGVHRAANDPPFSAADHRLVRLLHLELTRLWTLDALRRASDPATDLPPRLAQTLELLARGLGEKQIAAALRLSRHTIHNYVKALHKRFDVASRGELLAKIAKERAAFVPRLASDLHAPP